MERLIDDLGQAIFRIETNLEYLSRRVTDSGGKSAMVDLVRDLERLKKIKEQLSCTQDL